MNSYKHNIMLLHISIESAANRERRSSLAKYTCDNLTQLKLLQLLGKGTFGKVFLCEHRGTGKKMALKCLGDYSCIYAYIHTHMHTYCIHKCINGVDKEELVRSGHHHYVRREVQALKHFQHPFISEYYGTIYSVYKYTYTHICTHTVACLHMQTYINACIH